MFRKTLYIFLALCISLCIFIACDNGVAFVNEMKEDTSSGGGGGGGGGSTLIPITVTADFKEKYYDPDAPSPMPDPELTYTFSPDPLPSGVEIVGSLTREAGENVNYEPGYAITQGTLALSGKHANKYSLSYVGNYLAVYEKGVIYVKADAKTIYVGEAAPELTFTSQPRAAAMAAWAEPVYFSGQLTCPTLNTSVAGEYPIVYELTLEGEGAYSHRIVPDETPVYVTVLNPNDIRITADDKEMIYGSSLPAITWSANTRPDGISFSATGSDAPYYTVSSSTEAGEYDNAIRVDRIKIIDDATGNVSAVYSPDYHNGKMTITKRTLTVRAIAQGIKVGGAPAALDYTYEGMLDGDDPHDKAAIFDGSLSCPTLNVNAIGSYPIESSLTLKPAFVNKYVINYVPANVVVSSKTAVTITIDSKQKYYNDNNPTLTYSSSPVLPGGAFDGSLATTATKTSPVINGAYEINIGDLHLTDGYSSTYEIINPDVTSTLTIQKKPLNITVVNQTRTYGDNPNMYPFSFISNPVLPNGAFQNLQGFSCAVNAATPVSASENDRKITQSTFGLAHTKDENNNYYDDNYSIENGTWTNGLVTINPRPVHVTADAKAVYKGAGSYPEFTFTTDCGLTKDDFNGALECSGDLNTSGKYDITMNSSFALKSGHDNYSFERTNEYYIGAKLTVTEQTLVTIHINDAEKYYGDANPSFTYYTEPGLPPGALTVTLACTATSTTPVGSSGDAYKITIASYQLNGDYATTHAIENPSTYGILTINKKPVDIVVLNQTRTYRDSPASYPVDFVNSLGLPKATAFTNLTGFICNVSANTPVNASAEARKIAQDTSNTGLKLAHAKIGATDNYYDENYTIGTFTDGLVTINPKPVTISADNKTVLVGVATPGLTFTSDCDSYGVGFAGTLGLDPARTDFDLATDYEITQGGVVLSSANDNYGNPSNVNYSIDKYNSAVLTVTPKIPINVVAVDKTKTFNNGGSDPALTYLYTPPKAGITVVGDLNRVAGEKVGTYGILGENLGIDGDSEGLYEINFTPGIFTITKQEVTVTAENKEKYYGDDNPALTFNTSPALTSEAFTGAISWADNERNYHDYIDQNGTKDFNIIQGTLKLKDDTYGDNTKYVNAEHHEYGTYKDNYIIDFNQGTMTVDKPAVKQIAGTTLKAKIKSYHDDNDITSFSRSFDNPPGGAEIIDDSGSHHLYMWVDGTALKYAYTRTEMGRIEITDSAEGLFQDCGKFTTIDVSGLRLADSPMSAAHMFDSCVLLKEVNLAGLNTSKVTDMSYMFYKAGFNYFPSYATGVSAGSTENNSYNLVISNAVFDTSSVTNMSYMFSICAAIDLSGINMNSWDVSDVEDMSFMFAGYSYMDGKKKWYYWYTKITGFDISGWDTASCGTFENMFALSNRFTELNISGWDFSNVTNLSRMFERCESLGTGTNGKAEDDIKLVFPSHTMMTKADNFLYMFGKCLKLRRENFAAIVSTWDFTGNATAATRFANYSYDDTSIETIPSNRMIANMFSSTNAHYAANFKSRLSYTTYPNEAQMTLYIGGSTGGIEQQRLTFEESPPPKPAS